MSKKTVRNEVYKGLVEAMSIPAEVCERDGKKFATFGSVVPIHCCTPEQVSTLSQVTHHYCDIFSEELLAPFDELVFVRIDENTAEKVFINRSKRILLWSHDGTLAQWRCAPTFESANVYLPGAPIVNKHGALVSVVTAKRGNHYAVSTFEGESGIFSTSLPWKVLQAKEGQLIYGDKSFATRDELRAYIASLPPTVLGPEAPPQPIIHEGAITRVVLAANNGNQICHLYLKHVLSTDIEYL